MDSAKRQSNLRLLSTYVRQAEWATMLAAHRLGADDPVGERFTEDEAGPTAVTEAENEIADPLILNIPTFDSDVVIDDLLFLAL